MVRVMAGVGERTLTRTLTLVLVLALTLVWDVPPGGKASVQESPSALTLMAKAVTHSDAIALPGDRGGVQGWG